MKYPRCYLCKKPIRKQMKVLMLKNLRMTGNVINKVFYWKIERQLKFHYDCLAVKLKRRIK